MKLLRSYKIQSKVSILTAILLIISFLGIGFLIFLMQKSTLNKNFDDFVTNQIDAIDKSVQFNMNKNKIQAQKSLVLVAFYLQEENSIKISNQKTSIIAVNELTKEQKKIRLDEWYFQGKRLHSNTNVVDELKKFTGSEISIFQKTKNNAYVLISTTIVKRNGDKATGIFFPENISIVSTIERGESYTGKLSIDNTNFFVNARPYYHGGRIVGFLMTAVPSYEKSEITNIINNIKLIPQSTLYLSDEKGKLIYSSNEFKIALPYNLPYSLIKSKLFKIENIADDFQENILYAKRLSINNLITIIEVPKSFAFKDLYNFRKLVFTTTLIAILILFVGLYIIFTPFIKDITYVLQIMENFSEGKFNINTYVANSSEIEEIIKKLDIVSKSNSEKTTFTQSLISEDFDREFTPLSSSDSLSLSLLDLRRNLREAKNTIIKNKEKEEQMRWLTEGRSLFSDILRQYSNNIQILGDQLIKELVRFLDLPQAGIFITKKNKDGTKYLNLLTAYAYNRKKFMEKRISWGDGLIGACALEQYTMKVANIPADYLQIESGFGGKNPENLILCPIISENETLGVIELASFKKFPEYKIEFLKNMAEVIGSTITISQLNTKTNDLLLESREQIGYLKEAKDSLGKEYTELSEKYAKLSKKYADSEFLYKTQIVKKQMIIDELNKRLENID